MNMNLSDAENAGESNAAFYLGVAMGVAQAAAGSDYDDETQLDLVQAVTAALFDMAPKYTEWAEAKRAATAEQNEVAGAFDSFDDLTQVVNASSAADENLMSGAGFFGVMAVKIYQAAREFFDHEIAIDHVRRYTIVLLGTSLEQTKREQARVESLAKSDTLV